MNTHWYDTVGQYGSYHTPGQHLPQVVHEELDLCLSYSVSVSLSHTNLQGD